MTEHPAIKDNGYELCSVSQFLKRAPKEHIARFHRDCIGNGSFVIWDPNDDEQGFMVCANTVAELNREFLNHFAGFLS